MAQILDGLLKDQYFMKTAVNQLNEATIMLDHAEKTSKYVDRSGRVAKFPVQFSHPQGIGAAPFGGPIPTAVAPVVTQGVTDLSRQFLSIQVSIDDMERSKNDAGAFAEIFGFQMDSIIPGLRRDINRQWLTGSGAGDITRIGDGVTAKTTFAVDSTVNLEVGMAVELWDKVNSPIFVDATANATPTVTITNVDPQAGTITVSSAVTTAATSVTYIFRAGAKGCEAIGFPSAIDDGTILDNYLGISRVQNGLWKSRNQTASALRQINDAALFPGWTVIKKSGMKDLFAITSYELLNSYAGQLTTFKQFTNEQSTDLKGGYTGIKFQDIIMYADEQHAASEVTFVVGETWQIHQSNDLKWIEQGGSIMQRIPGNQFFIAEAYWFMMPVCIRPNVNVRTLKLQ